MNEIEGRRRANLRRVIDQRGSPTAVAKVLKLSGPSWLSQLVHGLRPFSEKTARKFEIALGLRRGYLDEEHGEREPGVVNVDVPLVLQTGACIESLLAERKLNVSRERHGALVSLVFAHSVKTGRPDEDYARKLVDLLSTP